MFFVIKASKDYRDLGYLRVDLEEGEAYITPSPYNATVIPTREGAYAALDLLRTGTVDAREGVSFELATI